MRNGKKLLALILALALTLSLAAPAFAGGAAESAVYSAVVRFEDGADVNAACEELERLPGVSVRWRYEALFSGAAIEGTAAALELAADCARVESLALSRVWTQPAAVGDRAGSSNSLDVLNGEDFPYDGDGMVIAVVDSGLLTSHEAFRDYGLTKNPALNEQAIADFISQGGTQGRYISAKIPFAYDYSGVDRSVHSADAHGTHVSALAVGYAEHEDGSMKFRGVAPAAQLLSMKVFPDNADLGAQDADVLKALEDALLLGADVVNLSLGTEGDFMEGDAIGALYQTAIAALRENGVIVCCATGNFAAAVTGKASGELPTAGYTDYGTACTPASYPGATAIAAVNAATREGGGGILVGDQTLSYNKGISTNTDEKLPDLDDLAGQTLPYVIIDGLGGKEDFEGMDLTGCVAVVMRGVIYFSEKVRNAADAGALACLIYNNEAGAIIPSVEDISIPCATITKDAGEYLIALAEDGRGTMRIEPDRVMVSTGERLTMMELSSWGATSGLKLVPALTAPGGEILSATPGGQSEYGYMSGTSMAAPNASGSFAALMQALRERGVTDKVERAELAEDLLASTAARITDENGVPLSPRRQGAGVIDLAAAAASRAVIVDPILELGESPFGLFELSFRVKNLTEEALTFSVDTTVLTDAHGTDGILSYSMLSPRDITDYVQVTGAKTLRVPAGGERTVRVTLGVERALREALAEVFTNGFFTEGYVTLTEKETGETIHATFLGYCGDWEAAPVIEQTDFRDVMDALAREEIDGEDRLGALEVNMWYNLPLLTGGSGGNDGEWALGENPWQATASGDERIAMSTRDSDALAIGGYMFTIDLYTLRNAAHVIMVVSDRRTGKIYYVDDTANLPRAYIDDVVGVAMNSGWFYWDGTDSSGNPLEDGTAVNVEFYAWTESETDMQSAYAQRDCDMAKPDSYRWLISGSCDKCLEWAFPLVLDGTSPVVSAALNEQTGEIELTVSDGHFVSYAAVQDGAGNYLAEQTFDGERSGETYVLSFALPEGGEMDTMVYVTAADYAMNITGYAIDLAPLPDGMQAALVRCPMAMFTDVNKDAWYHEAVDFVYENGLMDCSGMLTFSPDKDAMRASVIDVLYELAGRPDMGEVKLPFMDVPGNAWYYNALQWAYAMGIAAGYDETAFAALAAVSRQQLAVMLYRAAMLSGGAAEYDAADLSAFADGEAVSDWAREAVAWAVGEGYLSGDSEGKLNPRANTTRAELAQLLMNACQGKYSQTT